jgi:hypothetical protein
MSFIIQVDYLRACRKSSGPTGGRDTQLINSHAFVWTRNVIGRSVPTRVILSSAAVTEQLLWIAHVRYVPVDHNHRTCYCNKHWVSGVTSCVEIPHETCALTRAFMFLFCRSGRMICGRLSHNLPLESSSLGSELQYSVLFHISVFV